MEVRLDTNELVLQLLDKNVTTGSLLSSSWCTPEAKQKYLQWKSTFNNTSIHTFQDFKEKVEHVVRDMPGHEILCRDCSFCHSSEVMLSTHEFIQQFAHFTAQQTLLTAKNNKKSSLTVLSMGTKETLGVDLEIARVLQQKGIEEIEFIFLLSYRHLEPFIKHSLHDSSQWRIQDFPPAYGSWWENARPQDKTQEYETKQFVDNSLEAMECLLKFYAFLTQLHQLGFVKASIRLWEANMSVDHPCIETLQPQVDLLYTFDLFHSSLGIENHYNANLSLAMINWLFRQVVCEGGTQLILSLPHHYFLCETSTSTSKETIPPLNLSVIPLRPFQTPTCTGKVVHSIHLHETKTNIYDYLMDHVFSPPRSTTQKNKTSRVDLLFFFFFCFVFVFVFVFLNVLSSLYGSLV